MCGILCLLTKRNVGTCCEALQSYEACESYIKCRGPDFYRTVTDVLGSYTLTLSASVLWLQGTELTKQPISSARTHFAYNGDIFEGIPDDLRRLQGDTSLFLQCLEDSDNLLQTLLELHGPYAFIFVDRTRSKLYFARDIFGRRSLLFAETDEAVVITNAAPKSSLDFREVPPVGLYCMDLYSGRLEVKMWYNDVERVLAFKPDVFVERCAVASLRNYNPEHPSVSDLWVFKKNKDLIEVILKNPEWKRLVLDFEGILVQAVKRRIAAQPRYCKDCIQDKSDCTHSKIGVLFSGGVDCSILAAIADKFVDKDSPIDLLNVAFESGNGFNTPDRMTGLETLEELKKVCPERKWNFVEINVTKEELNLERKKRIKHLIHPLKTILDDSLGCAVWFAGRGKCDNYVSPCRVVLVGMGADELFGGYTHHRAALNKSGWTALYESLVRDWENLPYRNLGRDDRIVSDHGRQLRTPYLDESLVKFVLNLPAWRKTVPLDDIPRGVGDKILIRALAYHLGLTQTAVLKKRAIQFGSRIANKKENAHDFSDRL